MITKTKKEVVCENCSHRKVCSQKEQFLLVKKTISDVSIPIGEQTVTKLDDIPWIKVRLNCEYFQMAVEGYGLR